MHAEADAELISAKILRTVKEMDSFAVDKKTVRDFLSSELASISSDDRDAVLSYLAGWAFVLLKQRIDLSRYVSLLTFSFLIEVDDNVATLRQLASDLEKLLPTESMDILSGIAHLFARLSELISPDFLARIFSRCVDFLTTRTTTSAVQTAVILMKRLSPRSNDLFQNSVKELPTVIWTALKFPNRKIQDAASEIYVDFVFDSANANDLLRGMVSMCLVSLQSYTSLAECISVFTIFRLLLKRSSEYVTGRFDDVFNAICSFVTNHQNIEAIEIFATMCEMDAASTRKHMDQLIKLFECNWVWAESCQWLVRIAELARETLGPICSRKAFELLEAEDRDEKTFFTLSSVDYPEPHRMLKIFEECTEFSREMVDSAIQFLRVFPAHKFGLVRVMTRKIDADLGIGSFNFIHKIEGVCIFPFHDYFERIFPLLSDANQSDDAKVVLVKALVTIMRNDSRWQEKELKDLLFVLSQQVLSDRVIVSTLEEVSDSLIPCFAHEPLLSLLVSLMFRQSTDVRLMVMRLLKRIKKFSLTLTFCFLYDIFEWLRKYFGQVDSIVEKRAILELWPTFIDTADGFLLPFSSQIVDFLLEQLMLKVPPAEGFIERVNLRKTVKDVVAIHVVAMKSIQVLVAGQIEVPDFQRIVDHLIAELGLFNTEKVSLVALETLRIVFRCRSKAVIDKVQVTRALFKFVASWRTRTVLRAVLRVLGTLGPASPLSIHEAKIDDGLDRLPLYDSACRERCYLEFVMGFIMESLKQKCSDHYVLINAILYIFQFSASKSTGFLVDLIPILSELLPSSVNDTELCEYNGISITVVPCDSIFHMLKSIVLLVGAEMEPFAQRILEMVRPFIQDAFLNLAALKVMGAVVYALKEAFSPFTTDTFSYVSYLLSKDWDSEIDLNLLQILTHLVIFCNGSCRMFLRHIRQKSTADNSLIAPPALRFLGQAISCSSQEELLLPAAQIAIALLGKKNERDTVTSAEARKLLSTVARLKPVLAEMFLPEGFRMETVSYEVTADYMPQRSAPQIDPLPVSGALNVLRAEKIGETWLLHVCQNLVLCSSSPAIRSCHPLLRGFPDLAPRVFPILLLSVWDVSSDDDRHRLSDSLLWAARSRDAPVSLLRVIVDAINVMDKAGYELFTPEMSGEIAESCRRYIHAIRFYEKAVSRTDDIKRRSLLLVAKMHYRNTARGIFNVTQSVSRDPQVLEELSMWEEACKACSPDGNESSFVGYIASCARLGNWKAIDPWVGRFDHLSAESKRASAPAFAMAAMVRNSDADRFLEQADKERQLVYLLRAVVAFNKQQYKAAHQWLQRGLIVNSNDMESFISGCYESTVCSITYAMFLEEFGDALDVVEKRNDFDTVMKIWNSKNNWVRTRTVHLQALFLVRRLLDTSSFGLLHTARKIGAWELYDNACERLTKAEMDEPSIQLLQAKVRFDRGQVSDTNELMELVKSSQSIFASAVCATWRRSDNPSVELTNLVKEALDANPCMIRAWRYWAYGNRLLYRQTGDVSHAIASIDAFGEVVGRTGPCIPCLCQMCALGFASEVNYAEFMKNLSDDSIVAIIDILVTQIAHQNESVRNNVTNVLSKFMRDHSQAMVFPLAFVSKSDYSVHFRAFVDAIQGKRPVFINEVLNVSNGLLSVACFAIESIEYYLQRAIDAKDNGAPEQEIVRLCARAMMIAHLEHKGIDRVIDDYSLFSSLLSIENMKYAKAGEVFAGWDLFKSQINKVLLCIRACRKLITPTEIMEVAPELLAKHSFSIVVPGQYKSGSTSPTISRIDPIAGVVESEKRSRTIVMTGSDGKTYKFLARSGEDLRVDQRVMEWLSLMNSALRSGKLNGEIPLHISKYSIIPLSSHAGLVNLTSHGETLSSLIKWKAQGDTVAFEPKSNDPHERLEAFRHACRSTSSDLLREAIWLRSICVEDWLRHKTRFVSSTAVMSVVGYVSDFGERNPLNIMYKHDSGDVVHLDFQNCFGRAMKRESVPFRLTRMIVSVFGVGDVNGVFSISAENVLSLLRRNRFSLIAFLDVFADVEKIKFETVATRLAQAEIGSLIKAATDESNLSQMESNWAPHW